MLLQANLTMHSACALHWIRRNFPCRDTTYNTPAAPKSFVERVRLSVLFFEALSRSSCSCRDVHAIPFRIEVNDQINIWPPRDDSQIKPPAPCRRPALFSPHQQINKCWKRATWKRRSKEGVEHTTGAISDTLELDISTGENIRKGLLSWRSIYANSCTLLGPSRRDV